MFEMPTLRRALPVLVCPILTGCIKPNLGEVYVAELHGVVAGDAARVVIYPAAEVDSGIVFHVKIGGEQVGRVFQETFFSHALDPGSHTVVVQEHWSGEGWGKDLGNAVNPVNIFEPVEISLPESLNPRAETAHSLEIQQGQVVYLQVRKEEGKEYFFSCEETRETTTMCRGVRYDTAFEVVEDNEAQRQLAGRRESL